MAREIQILDKEQNTVVKVTSDKIGVNILTTRNGEIVDNKKIRHHKNRKSGNKIANEHCCKPGFKIFNLF